MIGAPPAIAPARNGNGVHVSARTIAAVSAAAVLIGLGWRGGTAVQRHVEQTERIELRLCRIETAVTRTPDITCRQHPRDSLTVAQGAVWTSLSQ